MVDLMDALLETQMGMLSVQGKVGTSEMTKAGLRARIVVEVLVMLWVE